MNPKRMITNQKENELIVHQNIVRVKGILTLNQGRGMRTLLKHANDVVYQDPTAKNFKISIKDFIRLTFINRKTNQGSQSLFDEVYHDMKNLIDIKLEWGTTKEREMAVFLQYFKITDKYITFLFSDYVRYHIAPNYKALILDNFEMIQSFRGKYTARLYEHIKTWEPLGGRFFNIEELKSYLSVPNTTAYSRVTEFRTKVIDPAVKEMNNKSDLNIAYTTNKMDGGKAVLGFTFHWSKKKNTDSKK